MPDPWPAPPIARPTLTLPEPAAPVAHGSNRSRLALAASVLLLVAGSLLLPGQSPVRESTPPLPRLLPGEATRVRLTETLIQPKDKPTEWRIEVTEDVPAGKK
jgi:hypothetical protein